MQGQHLNSRGPFYSSSRCRPTCSMSRTNFTLRGRGSFLGSELTYGDIYNDREIVRFCPKAHEWYRDWVGKQCILLTICALTLNQDWPIFKQPIFILFANKTTPIAGKNGVIVTPQNIFTSLLELFLLLLVELNWLPRCMENFWEYIFKCTFYGIDTPPKGDVLTPDVELKYQLREIYSAGFRKLFLCYRKPICMHASRLVVHVLFCMSSWNLVVIGKHMHVVVT